MLEKKDLEQIEKIVERVVERSEEKVISIIGREVSDLAEINRAVIEKVDTISVLEKRVRRLEHKAGIVS